MMSECLFGVPDEIAAPGHSVISIVVPGLPVPQPRQRHRIVNTGDRQFTQNYTPQRDPVNSYKATVRQVADKAMNGQPPMSGPIELALTFLLPRPGRLMWKKRAMPRLPHDSRPDVDNLGKSFMDASKGIVWNDDTQVAKLTIEKFYAAGDESPRTIAIVMRCLPVEKSDAS